MKSDFMERTAKIIAEIRARTCIDEINIEVLEKILQDELYGYYDELDECYDDGYEDGYTAGHSAAESDNEAYTQEAIVRAYEEGYSLGYSDCRSEGNS